MDDIRGAVFMDIWSGIAVFMAYAACIILVFFLGKLLWIPVRFLLKMVISSLAGGLFLLLLSALGRLVGIFIPVNLITAAITGILGIPGVIGMLIYFNIFSP